jgi:hypothetical protein
VQRDGDQVREAWLSSGGDGNPPTIGGAHEGIAVDGRLPPQWEEVEQAPTAARVQEDATWRVARS